MARKSAAAEVETTEASTSPATDQITIAGQVFAVPVRYSAGMVLTDGEASALNQTYHENLRNNFAKVVKESRVVPPAAEGEEPGTKELSEEDIAALQSQLDAYAAEYQFGVRVASTRTPVDPVEREALNLAKEAIRGKLKELKRTASAEQVAELAAALVEKNPQLRAIAAQRVAAAQSIANVSLDELTA